MSLHPLVRNDRIQSFKAAFAGAPELVVVSPVNCMFDIQDVKSYEVLMAESRPNISCAMRFSEPPVSIQARDFLCQEVRRFLPMNPDEGVLPLRVDQPDHEEEQWLQDREGDFNSLHENPALAKQKMSNLCNAACSALGAAKRLTDDRQSHWVTATVPNKFAYPILLQFRLTDMACEAGWTYNRPIALLIGGSPQVSHATVRSVEVRAQEKLLIVTVSAFPWSHNAIARNVELFCRNLDVTTVVDVCVRLCKPFAASNPVYDIISRYSVYERLAPGTSGDSVVNVGYGIGPLACAGANDPVLYDPNDALLFCTLNGRRIELTPDQQLATALGLSRLP
ncbi:unnamed protein product, partial [Cylicostephanus goldi]